VLKYILKKAVRGLIPDELIDRKKQGFAVPIYDWYYAKFGSYLLKEMKEFWDNVDFFEFEEVLPFLPRRGWALLNVALWWNQYFASESSAQFFGNGGKLMFEAYRSLREIHPTIEERLLMCVLYAGHRYILDLGRECFSCCAADTCPPVGAYPTCTLGFSTCPRRFT